MGFDHAEVLALVDRASAWVNSNERKRKLKHYLFINNSVVGPLTWIEVMDEKHKGLFGFSDGDVADSNTAFFKIVTSPDYYTHPVTWIPILPENISNEFKTQLLLLGVPI